MSEEEELENLEQQIVRIQEACAELGWSIALNDSSSIVEGLVIGTSEFVRSTLNNMVDGELYEVWGSPGENKKSLH